MKLNINRKIALAATTVCLFAMSSATAWAQGNSAFGRGQRTNHFKGRGNALFGRTNAMTHSAGHGNSAFGLGQFNGPVKGSGNSAFGRGGRHFASMPSRGWQTFTRNGMGNWSGQRWGGRNWHGGNWGGDWNHHNDIIFIGDFGFPLWWGWYPWGFGYPYGYYDYGYPYGSYGYGYGGDGYGYGDNGYGYGDNGYGYSYGGNNGSYYGDTGDGNRYPTHSRVAELQRRLTRAGYYSGAIDGIMGPATQRAIRAFERDHGYAGSSDGT
jgi:putative peptidoglycan binding protein